MWAHGFRDSFTPLEGVLFTFPSRYSFTIGLTGVFSLAGWSRRIRAGLHVPRVTQDTTRPRRASRTGLSPSTVGFSMHVPLAPGVPRHGPTTPQGRQRHTPRFGLFPGRSPLLGESLLFSFPAGTKMFQFPALASRKKSRDGRPSACRVVPFGDPRINGHLHLPADYRSLSRPSSPP